MGKMQDANSEGVLGLEPGVGQTCSSRHIPPGVMGNLK